MRNCPNYSGAPKYLSLHKKNCPNMPKWHGLNFGHGDPQELKTTKKVIYLSNFSVDPPWCWTIRYSPNNNFNVVCSQGVRK